MLFLRKAQSLEISLGNQFHHGTLSFSLTGTNSLSSSALLQVFLQEIVLQGIGQQLPISFISCWITSWISILWYLCLQGLLLLLRFIIESGTLHLCQVQRTYCKLCTMWVLQFDVPNVIEGFNGFVGIHYFNNVLTVLKRFFCGGVFICHFLGRASSSVFSLWDSRS